MNPSVPRNAQECQDGAVWAGHARARAGNGDGLDVRLPKPGISRQTAKGKSKSKHKGKSKSKGQAWKNTRSRRHAKLHQVPESGTAGLVLVLLSRLAAGFWLAGHLHNQPD